MSLIVHTLGQAVVGSATLAAHGGLGLTAHGWWLLFMVFFVLLCGMLFSHALLVVLGLALLLWFGWEWFLFNLRVQTTLRDVRVERVLKDERGPIATLWHGRTFEVRVRLLSERGLPFVRMCDFVPFAVDVAE